MEALEGWLVEAKVARAEVEWTAEELVKMMVVVVAEPRQVGMTEGLVAPEMQAVLEVSVEGSVVAPQEAAGRAEAVALAQMVMDWATVAS